MRFGRYVIRNGYQRSNITQRERRRAKPPRGASSDIKAEAKKKILQKDLGIPMTSKIESEVTEMCNLSDIEERGRKKGKREGKKEGVDMTRIEVIKKLMKKYNQSLEEALDFMDLTEKEKKHYRHMLTA